MVLCCCLVLVAVIAISQLLDLPFDTSWGSGVEGAEIDRTYDVGPSPELFIDNFAGDITVGAGDGTQIELLATRHARRSPGLERIEVEIRAQEGRLAIVTRNPERLNDAWVRLQLTVPQGSSFDLKTSSGRVEITGLDGGGNAETSSGRVIARDLSGTVSLHTSSGNMSVENFDGVLKLHVSSGDINVQTAEGVVDAQTSSGRLQVRDAQGAVRLDTSSGSIDYQGRPAGKCSFAASSGSVRLRLPSDLGAAVDLKTRSGTLRVGFPVEGQETPQRVLGTIGNGEDASIYAETSSGSIRITSE
jgi:DUF4097 and DUF4098 domain-containing protein YvlB